MVVDRVIGRWAMTALVINTIIGSGIFGLPAELIRLLGNQSPLAMGIAAGAMALIAIPIAEVASQFAEPGGLYLYTRVAFGRFFGLQVGWFWILAVVGGGAAGAHLFLSYLANFLPIVKQGAVHTVALLLLIAVPTIANYVGVRSGIVLSTSLTIAKLLPILLLITLGLWRSGAPATASAANGHPSFSAWMTALLLLVFSYSGYEDALVPMGEVQEPRRTVPFALGLGIASCAILYMLLQTVIVRTVGSHVSESPMVDSATVLLGRSGALFVAAAVMFSTYGWISTGFLSAPRLLLSFALQGDAPAWLGQLHPRFRTPQFGILLYAAAVTLLAVTGTFLWTLAVTAGSAMILYAAGCAALIRLRGMHPHAERFRAPGGPVLAVVGIAISIGLLCQLEAKQVALMSLNSVVAILNWIWAKGHDARQQQASLALGQGAYRAGRDTAID